MRNITKKDAILVTLISLLHSSPAFSRNIYFNVGSSIAFNKVENDQFQPKNQINSPLKNLSLGVSTKILGVDFVFGTNRAFANYQKNSGQLASRLELTTKSISEIDSISFNKRLGNISAGPFLANASIKTKYYYQDEQILQSKESEILYGLNVNYFVRKNISLGIILLAPNSKLSLKYGVGFKTNFYF